MSKLALIFVLLVVGAFGSGECLAQATQHVPIFGGVDSALLALCKQSEILEVAPVQPPVQLSTQEAILYASVFSDARNFDSRARGCAPFWDIKLIFIEKSQEPVVTEVLYSSCGDYVSVRQNLREIFDSALTTKAARVFDGLIAKHYPNWREVSAASQKQHDEFLRRLMTAVSLKTPNQSLEPTTTAVTHPAGAGCAPAVVVAHL